MVTTMKNNALWSTSELLLAWGSWARESPANKLNYPGATTFRRFMGGSIRAARIDERDALLIDRLLSQYRLRSPLSSDAVVFYYVCRMNKNMIADRLRVNRRQVGWLIDCGVNFVSGGLTMADAMGDNFCIEKI